MGSTLYGGGATFRVWAPNADSVAVAGSFNGWSKQADPLAAEGNGYWSVDVDGARAGDGYKYVITYQSAVLNPWRPDPYGQAMATSVGDTLIHAPDFDWGAGSFQMPGWDELVIYELHVGTYSDEQGGGPGRLASVMARLDHLVELGVNAIQLLPPAEFPGGFSWCYNPSSIFTVETDYGGPDALKQLIRAAHERGLAMVCDVVYNHFGAGDAALWRFDGWHLGDKGGIYHYNDWRDFTEWGPRPDYGRPEVRQFLRDNALMWLEQYRFDGLRWDATSFIRNVYGGGDSGANLPDGWDLMRWINDEIDSRQPWKLSVAEDMQNNEWLTKPTGGGGAGSDSQWDSEGAVASAVSEPRHADCRHDNSPPRSRSYRLVCLRWLLLSTRRHRVGSALVPTLRAVVSRRRGAAQRTRDPGRPRHHLPLGAAVHAAAGRGRPALPPRGRGPLVGR
jgi:1,4-alpha-glucan branching enzyme